MKKYRKNIEKQYSLHSSYKFVHSTPCTETKEVLLLFQIISRFDFFYIYFAMNLDIYYIEIHN
jgi:hypothetical protein